MVFVVVAVLGLVVYIGSSVSNSPSPTVPNPIARGSSDHDKIYQEAKAKFDSSIAEEYRKLIEFQKAGDAANAIRILTKFTNFNQLGYRNVAEINRRIRTEDYLRRLQKTAPNDYRALSEIYLGLRDLYPDNQDYVAKSAKYASALKRQVEEKMEREKKATEEREARARKEGKDDEAWIMAQEFVKERLKSPSTASFGSYSEQNQRGNVKDLGNGVYVVTIWVDSQNSFGAMLRTHFVLKLSYDGGKTWTLVGEPLAVQQ